MRVKGASGTLRSHNGFRRKYQRRLEQWVRVRQGTELLTYFQNVFPTCHLLSSEGTRMADGEGAPRSPSITGRAQQDLGQGQMGTALKSVHPGGKGAQYSLIHGEHKGSGWGDGGGAVLATSGSRWVTEVRADSRAAVRGWRPESQGELTVARISR